MRRRSLPLLLLLGACGPGTAPLDDARPQAPDGDADGFGDDVDCDDIRPHVNPGAPEVCNGLDDDCDGKLDVGASDAFDVYADTDGDGHGGEWLRTACSLGSGEAAVGGDCDDHDPAVAPGATETCQPGDEDCDGVEGSDDAASDATTWYLDADGDGYGDVSTATVSCDAPLAHVLIAGDCDDARVEVSPTGVETCNEQDDDCDGTVDEPGDLEPSYADRDGDGHGDPALASWACPPPEGFVTWADDCDDVNSAVFPGAPEYCDEAGTDEDCDGLADDDDSDSAGKLDYFLDGDADGFGTGAAVGVACHAPLGHSSTGEDCDDSRPDVSPDSIEVCDGLDADENCDGVADDATASDAAWLHPDVDADGQADIVASQLGCPEGDGGDPTDCDDTDPASYLDAPEVLDDGIDQDCDGIDKLSGVLSGTVLVEREALLTVEGERDDADFGGAVVLFDDMDGDDLSDLAIGSPQGELTASLSRGGVVYVFTTEVVGTVPASYADATPYGIGGSQSGLVLANVGHLYDDAHSYLLVGSVTGAFGFPNPYSDALAYWQARDWGDGFACTPDNAGDRAGAAVTALGEADGDAFDDWVMGLPGDDTTAAGAGAVTFACGYVESDPFTYHGESRGDAAGFAVGKAGDLDGDGLVDMSVGAPGSDAAHVGAGRVYIVTGLGQGSSALSDADATWDGSSIAQAAGWALGGGEDLDGDGRADVVVGSIESGAWVLFDAADPGTHDLARADAWLEPEQAGDGAGRALAVSSDATGDGQPDLLVAAHASTRRADGGGTVYVFAAPLAAGTRSLAAADAFLESSTSGGCLGSAVDAGGDRDGDGVFDIVIGDPCIDGSGSNMGAAFVLAGGAH